MKLIHAPHLDRYVVLGGRRRPTSYARRLRLPTLLGTDIPPPPAMTSYETAAMTALRRMFVNDTLGDCVIAGRGHRIGILTANAGSPFVYTDAQILTEYERIGSYNPSDPSTDQGCDMSTAADDGVSKGYADGSKDAGWIDVDATNRMQVMQAIELFEDGDIGFELPAAWVDSMPSADDFVWDVAGDPVPDYGHCVQIVDYDDTRGVRISTWGLLGWLTWPALAKYGARAAFGELIIHVNSDQIIKATQKAPNGFDWAKLVTFFDEMGGKVPMPAPAPTPAPPHPAPTPVPPAPAPTVVTLAQAQAWAAAGLAASWPKH